MKFRKTIIALCGALALLLCACSPVQPPIDNSGDGGGEGEDPSGGVQTPAPSLTDFRFTKEYFEGKSVVIYGDSITTARPGSAWGVDPTQNYVSLLSKELGYVMLGNFAVSGSSLTHSVSYVPVGAAKEDLYSGGRYADDNTYLNSTADYALIMYGANDFTLNAVIGTNEDDPQTYDEIVTYKGGIRYMVGSLRKANPEIKILFFTPLWRNDYGATPLNQNTGLYITDFGDALYDLARELEYRVIDCYPIFNMQNFVRGSDVTNDGVHPTNKGHRMMADYLLEIEK